MPVEFTILPARGLVYVRYEGHATVAEAGRAFGAYAGHPDARPGQKQLVDLAGVISFETDFAKLMGLQAAKADVFLAEGAQTLLVYHAPDRLTFDMSTLIRRSWEGIPGMAVRVLQTEAECLELLGQPERSIAALREAADIA